MTDQNEPVELTEAEIIAVNTAIATLGRYKKPEPRQHPSNEATVVTLSGWRSRSILVAGVLMSIALAGPTYAIQECTPGKQDSRIRYCAYKPGQIYHIWTAPGGMLTIQFSDNETAHEGNVMITDESRLKVQARGHLLYLKSTAKAKDGDTPCMVPEPLLVSTELPDGKLRPYTFQIETKPNDCSDTGATAQLAQHQQAEPGSLVSTASAQTRAQPNSSNLKYIKDGGLATGADIFYAAIFTYPDDDDSGRRDRARARRDEAEKRRVKDLLNKEVSTPYGNAFDGTWNAKYVAHGSMTPPNEIRDNGYQTVFIFTQMTSVPSLYRGMPGAPHCNTGHDDRYEATVIPSVHRGGSNGDTIIASGTSPLWCLRSGIAADQLVLEIRNLGYTSNGATPGTGTVSPYVARTLKADEPEPAPPPVPLVPQPRSEQQQPQSETPPAPFDPRALPPQTQTAPTQSQPSSPTIVTRAQQGAPLR